METFKNFIVSEMSGAGVSERQLHKELKSNGWIEKKSGQSGDHTKFVHPNSMEHVAVPRHKGDLSPMIVIKIRKQIKAANANTAAKLAQ